MSEAACDQYFETEKFKEIADAAPVALWRINASFEQDWVNQHWLDFTGGRLEEEVGFAWVEKVHPEDRERVVEEFDRAFDAREATTVEFRLRGKSGRYRWFRDSGTPLYRDGEFAGFIGSCVDITERKHAELMLGAKPVAQSVAEVRATLSGLVDHVALPLEEVRTEAAALASLLASREDLPADLAEAAARISRAAERAGAALDNCRPLAPEGAVKKPPQDLASLLRAAERPIRRRAGAEDTMILWDLAPGLEVAADARQVTWVFLNLAAQRLERLRNTLGRRLVVSAAAWGDVAVVSIAERGLDQADVGLPGSAEERPIDLYFCRLVIAAHGGRFWVEDDPTGGTIFRFTLPLSASPAV